MLTGGVAAPRPNSSFTFFFFLDLLASNSLNGKKHSLRKVNNESIPRVLRRTWKTMLHAMHYSSRRQRVMHIMGKKAIRPSKKEKKIVPIMYITHIHIRVSIIIRFVDHTSALAPVRTHRD